MTKRRAGDEMTSPENETIVARRNHVIHHKKAWLAISLAVLIIVAALYFLLKPKTQPAPLPTVEVETVGLSNVEIYGEYVGRIRAQQFVEIHARVEGYLQSMMFKEGSYIEKGQTLFVIDPKLYQAHVNKARRSSTRQRRRRRKPTETLKESVRCMSRMPLPSLILTML